MSLDPDNAEHWSDVALISLAQLQPKSFRDDCRALVEHFQESMDKDVVMTVAGTCVLAPDAGVDSAKILDFVKRAKPSDVDQRYFEILGAAQFRAGDVQEAIKTLSTISEPVFGDLSRKWLFLSMCYQRAGETEAAKEALMDAIKSFEERTKKGV